MLWSLHFAVRSPWVQIPTQLTLSWVILSKFLPRAEPWLHHLCSGYNSVYLMKFLGRRKYFFAILIGEFDSFTLIVMMVLYYHTSMNQQLRALAAQSWGPSVDPSTYVTSWVSFMCLWPHLWVWQRWKHWWGLLVSSQAQKTQDSGSERDPTPKGTGGD